MFTSLLVVFIALIGLLTYALASNGKVAELGRIAFACGLLAFCFAVGSKVLRLF